MTPRITIAIALFAFAACENEGGPWTDTPPDPPRLEALTAEITLHTGKGAHVVRGPVRATDAERQVGLMYRKDRLQDSEGMLFAMEDDADHGFWMRNTYIPLDLVFIDAAGIIVGIVPEVEPLTLESRKAGKPSRFVLEVDAGFARRHKLAEGQRADIRLLSAAQAGAVAHSP